MSYEGCMGKKIGFDKGYTSILHDLTYKSEKSNETFHKIASEEDKCKIELTSFKVVQNISLSRRCTLNGKSHIAEIYDVASLHAWEKDTLPAVAKQYKVSLAGKEAESS
ncbi:hypothetical protein WISP_59853 [Willisornis vidua]|uniref:Uncharacterized protein n=1 Tax=Willisornis vidua TaxID=1566151 RepID=A0ABQ9DBC0_9PASS|nr:hypothetical protein WISP_59853 [Willisornis vidua]